MLKLFFPIQFKNIRALLGKCFVLSLLLFSYSSCTDQGCIEADDFGEYEQQVLTIKANTLGGSCEYFPSKSIGDSEQGSGLKTCFNKGDITLEQFEAGSDGVADTVESVSGTGDLGCGAEEFNVSSEQICIENCIQECFLSSQSSGNSEPGWESTDKKEPGRNVGVTVTPGAEVIIRAIGKVVLGGLDFDPVYARADFSGLQSRDSNLTNHAFTDLQAGTARTVQFSGKWAGDGTTTPNFGGNISSDATTFNGARRLAAFLIPHPETGYSFNTEAADEDAGNSGVPLFANADSWSCDYSSDSIDEPNCVSGSTGLTDEVYPISSDSTFLNRQKNLGTFGGMIRWESDGLVSLDDLSSGSAIGDLSTSVTQIDNNEDYAVRLVLKNISSNDTCDAMGLKFSINGGAKIEASFDTDSFGNSLPYITLESGDNITFEINNVKYGGANTNCGEEINYKLLKLQDIKIEKSGFVSFTNVGTSTSSDTCTLNGRIINPLNVDGGSNSADDFYEYDNFDTLSSSDPLDNISVPTLNNVSVPTLNNVIKYWSKKVFVRKGQTIRIDPTSWDGSWDQESLSIKCGIGMAIKVGGISSSNGDVEDRPAFLCHGTANEYVPNPDCFLGLDPSDSSINICQAFSEDCFDQNNAKKRYCPVEACQVAFDDTPGGCEVENTSKTNASITLKTCEACFNAKQVARTQDVSIQLNIDQCYDLENYTGQVSDIRDIISDGTIDDAAAEAAFAKGAKKLGLFDGSYGNFENFGDSGKTINSNKVYSLKKVIYPSFNGRLMFLIVDNDDFTTDFEKDFNDGSASTGDYVNNSLGDDGDNGSNGYQIDLSGQQEFQNGQWLEVILCLEQTDDSSDCVDEPTPVSDQPLIVSIDDATEADLGPTILSHYKFDEFGSLVRFNNPGAIGFDPDVMGSSKTEVGDFYYRHSYEELLNKLSISPADKAANDERFLKFSKLRLSFKIKDPDIGNCITSDPNPDTEPNCSLVDCDGSVTVNPFYQADRAGSSLIQNIDEIIGNTDETCEEDIPVGSSTSDHCQRQFFCASRYYNNSGEYQVVVKVKNDKSNASGLVDLVISPVIEIMDGKPDGSTIGQAERIYSAVVGDSRFQLIISMCFVVMITFYGVGYLMGVSEFSQSEILSRIIKVGIIYLFIGPNGWVWFDTLFVETFKNGTDYITFMMASAFDQSAELQNAIAANDFSDKSVLFGGIDEVFGMFISGAVQNKIWALLFASIFGPIYLFIIFLGFLLYVYAVANAVLLYLTAQIFISILFILGPIFFIMLMFSQTKTMFDKWLSELIGLSLQQIFLLTTLAFFSMMMYEVIKISLGYRICWGSVWELNLGVTQIKLLSFWKIASMPESFNVQSDVGNIGNPEGVPSLFSILFIWIIASLMLKFIDFMSDLAATIGGSVRATQLSEGVKKDASSFMKEAKSLAAKSFAG
ncbi:MAG: type IV secretory pathway VirB6-like protein, partial [Rickettsiales bacterium]